MTVATRHDARLQSLRGLAALTVAMGHSFTVPVAGRLEDPGYHLHPGNVLLTLGELAFHPNSAVIFFYVLSGFVLGEAIRRRPSAPLARETAGFVVRRVGRMVPVMWLSLALAVAVLSIIRGRPADGTTRWFTMAVDEPALAPAHILANFASLDYDLNGVLWSVQIELWIAPFFPLAARLGRRAGPAATVLVFAALAGGALALWGKLPNAALFAYAFWLGLQLPVLLGSPLVSRVLRSRVAFVAALAVPFPVEFAYDSGHLWMPYKFLVDTLAAAEIVGFVLLRPSGRISRALLWPPLVRLGDLSYSFYAFHLMALFALSAAVIALLPPGAFARAGIASAVTPLLALVSVALSLAVSALVFPTIERPLTDWGRRLGARIERGRKRDPAAVAAPAL